MPSSTEPRAPRPPRAPLYAGPGDRYFDYCLQPYEPRRHDDGDGAGKLRSENLFWHSLDLAGFIEAGLLRHEGARLWLTRRGMLLAHEVMTVFV